LFTDVRTSGYTSSRRACQEDTMRHINPSRRGPTSMLALIVAFLVGLALAPVSIAGAAGTANTVATKASTATTSSVAPTAALNDRGTGWVNSTLDINGHTA